MNTIKHHFSLGFSWVAAVLIGLMTIPCDWAQATGAANPFSEEVLGVSPEAYIQPELQNYGISPSNRKQLNALMESCKKPFVADRAFLKCVDAGLSRLRLERVIRGFFDTCGVEFYGVDHGQATCYLVAFSSALSSNPVNDFYSYIDLVRGTHRP